VFSVCSIAQFSAAAENQTNILLIKLNYSNESLTAKEILWTKGFVHKFSESAIAKSMGDEKAEIKIYSKKSLIYQSYFYIGNKQFRDSIGENGEISGGIIELDNMDILVIAPYFGNIDHIDIHSKYNDIKLTQTDLKKSKELKIFKVGEEKTNETGETTENQKETAETSEQKSFFLELTEVVNSVWYYIFG
jgi:hypothetical protein